MIRILADNWAFAMDIATLVALALAIASFIFMLFQNRRSAKALSGVSNTTERIDTAVEELGNVQRASSIETAIHRTARHYSDAVKWIVLSRESIHLQAWERTYDNFSRLSQSIIDFKNALRTISEVPTAAEQRSVAEHSDKVVSLMKRVSQFTNFGNLPTSEETSRILDRLIDLETTLNELNSRYLQR